MSPVLIIAGTMSIAGALGVIFSRAPVHSVIALILNLLGLAGLFLSLHAEFLAVVQVIVYAGAVMILFLFVIALLTVKREPLVRAVKGSGGIRTVLSYGSAVLIAACLTFVAFRLEAVPTAAIAEDFGSVATFGRTLLVTHVVPFEIAAFILMVALIGVVVLVGRDRLHRRDEG